MDRVNPNLPGLAPERYNRLRARLALDLLNIDAELEDISSVIQEAGEWTAQAGEDRDVAKDHLAKVEAQTSDILRRRVEDNGKAPSEAKITSLVPLASEVQEALALFSKTKLDAALWSNLQDSLRTKSHSIRAAADLVAAGFISNDYILQKRRLEVHNRGK